jgi:hypothetical protein
MTRAVIAGGTVVTGLVLLVLVVAVRYLALDRDVEPVASTPPAIATEVPGFLYGRVTDVDGVNYEGRLRLGGDQEAFWSDYFNGVKSQNRWAAHAPSARPHTERGIEIFGFTIGDQDRSSNLDRQFMARFGDIARIEAQFAHVLVTLKSGTVVELDRFSAGDIDDGMRVWDRTRSVVNLDTRRIRTIEFLPTAPLVAAPARLHGTVRTRLGEFTGFIQWDRHDCVGADELDGRALDGGERQLRYDTIRSIARQSRDSVLVTLIDGRAIALSGTREVGRGHRGIYIDDVRYGRVLIPWDAFERVEFNRRGSGPAYSDFRPGRPLAGSVTRRDGRRLTGRLVFDFDESETTETLDIESQDIDYYIPLDLVTSIVTRDGEARDTQPTRVTLRDGEQLYVERAGDVGDGNAGMLIFVDGGERPEYVSWADVEQIDFDP